MKEAGSHDREVADCCERRVSHVSQNQGWRARLGVQFNPSQVAFV